VLPVGQFVGHSAAAASTLYATAKSFELEKSAIEEYA
jgi:hypothetical protein